MSDCNGDCGNCASNCTPSEKKIKFEPANKHSKVKKLIGVISGKGGVGKSLTTSYLSVLMQRKGYKIGILDADITGPSIPKTFGLKDKLLGSEYGIIPAETKNGNKVVSVNLLLDSEEMPVLWRGPIIAGTVKQFWSEVYWGDVDYMFVDMPPGTGDVALTVFQSLPLDGIVIVTSPQELVSMIVAKAVNMAKAMNVPILGVVENYSYIQCGNCGEKISVFGESHLDEAAKKYNLEILDRIPIDPAIAKAVDKGEIEELRGNWLDNTADYIEKNCPVENKDHLIIAAPVINNNEVAAHFAKAEQFSIFEFDNKTLVSQKTVDVAEQSVSEKCQTLLNEKIEVLLCGGMNQEVFQTMFTENVRVIPGMQGDIQVAVASFLDENMGK